MARRQDWEILSAGPANSGFHMENDTTPPPVRPATRDALEARIAELLVSATWHELPVEVVPDTDARRVFGTGIRVGDSTTLTLLIEFEDGTHIASSHRGREWKRLLDGDLADRLWVAVAHGR